MSCAVVPAAGAATRFGGGKLFALVDGVPMLDRTIGALLDAGIDRVIVVTPPDEGWGAGVALLRDPRVSRTVNPDPSRGMFSSIQAGVRLADSDPIAVLPADMPFVKPATIVRVLDAARGTASLVSPRFEGRRGHPVVLPLVPRDVTRAIVAAEPTAMLNEVLKPFRDRVVNVDVDDPGVVRDVDVREDLPDPVSERTRANPRERSGDHGVPASERAGGFGGAEPPERS